MNIYRRLSLSVIGLFWIIFSIQGQDDFNKLMPIDSNVRIGKLSNGLTYYIRKNTKPEKRVELRLVVNTGSVLEDEDQLGLAHFMEHMNFNGTKRFPKNELVSYLQSIGVEFGADLNAYTSFDETVYILPVPTDKPGLVDKGLQILEDWAHNASLDSLEIEKERGVVIEEWRLSRGADERMMRQTLPVQYQGSKYAIRLPIGTRESLQNFTHDKLKRFYKEWYRPDMEAVVVVGDIDVDEMEKKIREYFGDIPAPATPRKRESFPVPDHQETLTVVAKDKEAAFPGVEIMFKKEKQADKTFGDYARDLTQQLFTNMLNSRFQDLARKPNPPFIAAGSYYGGTYARTKDAYQLFANSSDTGLGKAIYTLLEENRRVALYGFTEAELERQKRQMLSSYERSYNERNKNESGNVLGEYIRNFLEEEPIPGIEWEYNFVKNYLPKIKLDDVNKLAAQWLSKNSMVVTVNAPEKEGIRIPTSDEIKQIISSVEVAKIEPYTEKAVASELLAKNKLKPGRIVSEMKNDKLGTTTFKLSNGVTVVLKPTDFKNDEILVRAYSKGGHSLAPNQDYYSAINASQIVQQSGVGEFTASDLSKTLKGKNTAVSANIGQLTEGINGSTTPKEIETLFQLINLYFTAPRKDKDAFTSYVTRQKQFLANVRSNPDFYYSNELQKILTQNHPRGGGIPKPEDFDKISQDKAFEFYKQRFADASDFIFFFVGSFETEKIKPLLETYLGSLPTLNKKENFKDLGIRPPKGKIDKVIKKGTEPQSQVNIIFTGPAKYDAKEAYALRSLGEVMDIKLVEQLREEKGEVYGAGAFGTINKYPYPNFTFNISFPCAPENVEGLTKAALKELEKIRNNGLSKEDLAKIKEQQKRKLEVDMKQNQFWMSGLYEASFFGNNPEDILVKQKQVENLSSKMIQDVAKKYIDLNNYIRVTLMPEKAETKKEEKKPF
jgi:zinc protease